MNKILLTMILLTGIALGQQPCPTGYHHEKDSSACWPDISRQEPTGMQFVAQPIPAQPVQVQPSSLVIFREGHFTGSALKPSIYIDGREVTRLKNGTYFSMQIEPGKHSLGSSAKHESPLLLEIKPGETNYVQMIVVTGTWRGAGRLVPVSPDDGKVAVAKLHLD